jgi:hypothetical protein
LSRKPFFVLASFIAFGRVPSRSTPLLSASRLIALSKPTGGIRPIVIGECLLRVVGKAICRQLRPAFSSIHAPMQRSVGVASGAHALVASLHTLREAFPTRAILQTDISNAFNTISGRVIFEELHDSKGPLVYLLPFLFSFYYLPSPLHFQHH